MWFCNVYKAGTQRARNKTPSTRAWNKAGARTGIHPRGGADFWNNTLWEMRKQNLPKPIYNSPEISYIDNQQLTSAKILFLNMVLM